MLLGMLNWFAIFLLGLPFSSSLMLPFCGHFYCVSHQQSNPNKFKDFKTVEYYGIRIETSGPTTVEYRRMKKLGSETKIRII